jgi:uncharacterized small protein (DUF1192 family)
MRKLDRSQPFGEIYGSNTARYEQHGVQFDPQGNELPGFEEVVIPDAVAVVASSDDGGLLREIGRLTDEVRRLQAALDDKDAAYEEAVGQMDTTRVIADRLQAEVDRLTALLPLDAVAAGDAVGTSDVDLQLDLQTGGNAGKKGK